MAQESAQAPEAIDLVTLNRAATVARLLSGAAHEVNNALQVIGGTTELLQMTPDLPESVTQALQRVSAQNVRAAGAIAEVLVFARQKGDMQGRVNLRDIATRSLTLRSFAISRARLTASLDPAPDSVPTLTGNAALLQLAVLNLIVNAEQALAGRQGGAIRIGFESSGQAALRVSDNGPGVDAAIRERIFEPFFTTRPRDEASGLGLAVARHVAEAHGGTLVLEGNEAGASFVLRLPVKPR